MNLKEITSDSIIESLIDEVQNASKKRIETLAKDVIVGMAAIISLADRASKIKKMPPPKILINNGLTLDNYKHQIMKWLGHNMSAGEIKAELEKLNFKISASSIHNFIHKLRQTTPEVPLQATLEDAIILLRSYGFPPKDIVTHLNNLGFKTNKGTMIRIGTIHFFYYNENYLKKDYRYQHSRALNVAPSIRRTQMVAE